MSKGEQPVVLSCTCKHEYQDQLYGKGKRLHNVTPSNVKKANQKICTVCGERKN